MSIESNDTFLFNGQTLKQKVLNSVSDATLSTMALKNPSKYGVHGAEYRPNLFKARKDAVQEKMSKCSSSEPWVREIISKWCQLSGHLALEADFYRDSGFLDAVKNARDIQIRRYLDDDGWGWIVIRDIPSNWINKKRVPEATRQQMVALNRKKSSLRTKNY